MQDKVICLILGGGKGDRLAPLTEDRSKPAVPIAGKYRIIDIPISNCLNSDIRRMFVLTQYNSASLNRHIKRSFHFDNFSNGFVDILAAEQTRLSSDWFKGTADAVRQTLPRLASHDFEYIMVLSGDQLYQMDFVPFLKQHIDREAEISIATIPVGARDASAFGIMKVDADHMISDFTEKPGQEILGKWSSEVSAELKAKGRVFLASMGIYIFNKAVLNSMLAEDDTWNDFGKHIIPKALERKMHVVSYPFDGYWTDIGSIHSFFEANLMLADPVPDFNLFDNESIVYTRPRMLSPTKLFGTHCERALIADGCIINAKKIYRSVIGVRSRIGIGTEISNSYVMGLDTYQSIETITSSDEIPLGIGPNCKIENAIIDRNAAIGEDVVIIGHIDLPPYEEPGPYAIKDGIVVVKKGAIIPPGSRIGKVDE